MFHLFKKKSSFWPSWQLRDGGILAAGLVVFVVLCASTVDKFSIWFDEAFGSYLIRFNFFDLTRYTSADVHPPLYYWLLKLWSLAFGNTELGIRSMSIFFGVVTIVFAFMLAYKLFGRRVAYVSLLFLVISPVFVRYSQEARMYTLLTAIIVAATYVLVYARTAGRRWPWIVYGSLLAMGMLTQYFAALAWLAHWVWRAVTLRARKGEFKKTFFTRQWVIAHVVAIGIFVPWLPWFVIQFANVQGNGFWIPPITSVTIPDFFTTFLLFSNHDAVQSWLALLFYGLVVLLLFLAVRLCRQLKGETRDNYVLMMCMVIVPIVLLAILSMPPLRPAFVDRYLMGSVVFLPILIAVTIVYSAERVRPKVLVGVGIVIVGMMALGLYNQSVIGNYNMFTHQSNNVRQLLQKVRASDSPNVPIVANTPWIFYEAVTYERSDSSVYFVNETTQYKYGSLRMLAENNDHKIMDVDAFARQHPTFWVIANLRDGEPNKLRDSWHITDTIVINDDVAHTPLFKAIRVSAE